MAAPETKKLKAISNKTRLLLLRLIFLDKDMSIEKINSHIKIDSGVLMYHMDILKNADLIRNNTFDVDGEQRTVYNISKEGRNCLTELGFS